jgi:hypothetical protein
MVLAQNRRSHPRRRSCRVPQLEQPAQYSPIIGALNSGAWRLCLKFNAPTLFPSLCRVQLRFRTPDPLEFLPGVKRPTLLQVLGLETTSQRQAP